MPLSSDLISQFVKVTKDNTKKKKETIAYGTIVEENGSMYVQLDGSKILTPISNTSNIGPDDRVTVMIKNHTAMVTGNLTSPSARYITKEDGTKTVENLNVDEVVDKINEFEIIVANTVSSEELEVERGRIDTLVSEQVTIRETLNTNKAEIDSLEAQNVTITEQLEANSADITNLETTKLDVDIADAKFATITDLDATNATVHNLESTYGDFVKLSTDNFDAIDANIKELDSEKLSTTEAELKFANIDFSNIGKAAMEYFYSESGLINDITIGDATISGEIVGVTIRGDRIIANTVAADKLVIKGSDGIYYKLNIEGGATASEEVTDEQLQNGLHGDVIIAKTITAEKITVDDLVAFGATIGGFNITKNSIYSAVKESVDNTTRGLYMDTDGQFAFGNATDYLKFFKDSDGTYKLIISANSVVLNSSNKSVEDAISEVQSSIDNIEIGGRNLIRNSKTLLLPGSDGAENKNISVIENDYVKFTPGISGNIYVNRGGIATTVPREQGVTYTLSFEILTPTSLSVYWYPSEKYVNEILIQPSEDWQKISFTYTQTGETTFDNNTQFLFGFWRLIAGNEYKYKHLKLEKGNRATDWTPAPEDLEARVYTAETQITQNAEGITEVMTRTTNNETAITTLEKTADGLTVRMSNAETDIQDASKTATNFIEASTAGVVIGDMTAETLGRNVHIDTDSVDIRKGDIVLASYGDNEVYIGKNNRESKLDLCNGVAKLYNSTSDNPDLTYNKLWIEADHAIELNTEHLIGLYSNYSETERAGIDIKSSLPWSDTSTQIDPKVVIRAEDTPIGSSYIETHARQIELFSIGDSNENGAQIRLDGVAGRVHIGEATNDVYMHPNVYFKSSPILENNTPLYAKNTANNPIDVLHLSTGGNCVLGYGAYNGGQNTHVYGADIVLFSKEADASVRPYYRPGDSFTIDIYTAGFVTNSGTEVWFTLPLSKPVIGVTTITLSSVSGFVLRQNGLYTHGSTLSSFCNPSTYKAYLHASQEGIRVKATFNYTDNAVNNSPIGIRWSGEITFS